MILAAGRGERMRPLTDHCPKPLLPVGGKPLIVWHLERLAQAGFREVVINHAWLGDRIEAALGNGARWGLRLRYSPEATALETAGGIVQAQPWGHGQPVLVINGDVWCDWPLARAASLRAQLESGSLLAWCVLVDNPDHHPEGDFGLAEARLVDVPAHARPRFTFAGIGLYAAGLFDGLVPGQSARLAPLLRQAAAGGRVGAEHYAGRWVDVGTPERLHQLDQTLALSFTNPQDVPR